ncbi:hypothetical protein F5Y15DRAFT_420581 [Xylariaceae sp. FL0016]|nr:hypothetical protein F5Y15DRAFT_420581 [Xylariaceae sp. FL0016]
MQLASEEPSFVRARVANACDTCKQRKVKCDGKLPCAYCKRRHLAYACHFSPSVSRRAARQSLPSSPASTTTRSAAVLGASTPAAVHAPNGNVGYASQDHASEEDEADVPREARLVRDAQGKLIFIGDCAPLSLFQTVRHIVTTRVDPNAFAPQTSHISMLENVTSDQASLVDGRAPVIDPASIQRLVSVFIAVTSGLLDLFETARLSDQIVAWSSQDDRSDALSAVYYLILAVGAQSIDEEAAARYFQYGKGLAMSSLGGNLSIGTAHAFTLMTMHMLRSCQINGAFLFFGIAVRAAYSIGVHRTEVNARFGAEAHAQRDHLWKSLRVLDLFLSISMGRPPATSDADCTVPYHDFEGSGIERVDFINASAQILLIAEGVVLQVYSRRKITLQMTDGISHQLRAWSDTWLSRLQQHVTEPSGSRPADTIGACQILSSYYYTVMLVSRPFLMYELCQRLPEQSANTTNRQPGNGSLGRSRLANACIDAACLMIEMALNLVERGMLDRRMPLIASWLFASSLVAGVGLLGGFGRALERYARMSITALDHFAEKDAHATQYSLIAESLLNSGLEYLDRREIEERRQITQNSSQLFGLLPKVNAPQQPPPNAAVVNPELNPDQRNNNTAMAADSASQWLAAPFGDTDPSIFSLSGSIMSPSSAVPTHPDSHDQSDDIFRALNLFPLLDGNGHIDLAHYL